MLVVCPPCLWTIVHCMQVGLMCIDNRYLLLCVLKNGSHYPKYNKTLDQVNTNAISRAFCLNNNRQVIQWQIIPMPVQNGRTRVPVGVKPSDMLDCLLLLQQKLDGKPFCFLPQNSLSSNRNAQRYSIFLNKSWYNVSYWQIGTRKQAGPSTTALTAIIASRNYPNPHVKICVCAFNHYPATYYCLSWYCCGVHALMVTAWIWSIKFSAVSTSLTWRCRFNNGTPSKRGLTTSNSNLAPAHPPSETSTHSTWVACRADSHCARGVQHVILIDV